MDVLASRRLNFPCFTTSSFADVDIYSNSEDLGSHFARLQRVPNIAKQIDDAVFGIWAAAYKELLDPPTFIFMARQMIDVRQAIQEANEAFMNEHITKCKRSIKRFRFSKPKEDNIASKLIKLNEVIMKLAIVFEAAALLDCIPHLDYMDYMELP
ncbi:uncharacterized protein BT62DRAFT_931380 [Guyanagaster necrorhizus]|uniref:Uncharacterized protein n=1 Tax=Guyanagaster necrorhizus TaxID=856835 RepID=A0A9P8ATB3_9AGAR|nr:uncharacterized protein BT62DRAFT_931380 [Guyanagaster necrorhizus MCA 3950]KAG7446811.1 hypothetical protein BT62DRAFT_931380 [Guyanagaster necrorhizus MCA 3950]